MVSPHLRRGYERWEELVEGEGLLCTPLDTNRNRDIEGG